MLAEIEEIPYSFCLTECSDQKENKWIPLLTLNKEMPAGIEEIPYRFCLIDCPDQKENKWINLVKISSGLKQPPRYIQYN